MKNTFWIVLTAAILCTFILNPFLAEAQEMAPESGLATMEFAEIDLRELIKVCAQQTGTNALVEKSVRRKVSVSCENESGVALLTRLAEEQNLLSCAIGEVTVYYEMPFNAYRRYDGPDNYTDLLPTAARVYRQRLTAADGLRVSIVADDKDIREVLTELATQAGVELREGYPVRGHIWVNLSDVPLADAVAAIVIANGYGLTIEDGAWIIGRAETFSDDD